MPHHHYIVHKPHGYLSQFSTQAPGEARKKLLGELHDFPPGLMAIGRLDEDSEGLLLLTTDGQASEIVRSSGVEKEYYAQVDGLLDEPALAQLRAGVEIGIGNGKYRTAPCQARRLEHAPAFAPRSRKIRDDRHGPTSWVAITLTEGKYRQVRKMTAAVGLPTLRLVRVRIGHLHLGNLPPGETLKVDDFGFNPELSKP